MEDRKKLEYYISLQYPLKVLKDTSEKSVSYVAYFPDLPGYITAGKTEEEAINNAADNKESWLIAAIEDGIKINEPVEKPNDKTLEAIEEARKIASDSSIQGYTSMEDLRKALES